MRLILKHHSSTTPTNLSRLSLRKRPKVRIHPYEHLILNKTNSLTAPSPDPRVTQLEYSSVQDVTHLVQSGSIDYTCPDDGGEYVLLAFWQRRTGYLAAQGAFNNATAPNNPASWFAYVVDHFSQEG